MTKAMDPLAFWKDTLPFSAERRAERWVVTWSNKRVFGVGGRLVFDG